MNFAVVLLLFVAGLVIGAASGLVGIGGGVLIVPLLYFFYAHPELSGIAMPVELQTLAANATSLFVIVPTAIRGTWSYHTAGLVIWRAVIPVGVASVIATVAGTRLALLLPGEVIRIAFGVFLLLNGIQLLVRPHLPEDRPHRINAPAMVLTGVTVGLLSGLMGIGGGAMAALLLIYLVGLDFKQAAATSLAIAGIAAITGTITYTISGLGVSGMPQGSIGYVHVFGALPILAGSIISVRWGTRANQRMHVKHLKLVFAAFFSALGLYLIAQNLSALF